MATSLSLCCPLLQSPHQVLGLIYDSGLKVACQKHLHSSQNLLDLTTIFIPIEVQYILHGTTQLDDIKAVLFKAGQEVTSVAEELVKWSTSTTGSDPFGLSAREAPCFKDLKTENSGASSSRSHEPQEVIVLPALPRALLSQLEEYSSSQYNCTSGGIGVAESTDFYIF